VRKSKDRWVGNVSNENSTLDWIWIDIEQHNSGEKSLGDDLEWAINYNISLSDLTDWFQVNIPISRPTGHWAGTLTPTEATISSSNLGFEGKIYALNRLQAGQPITYQPIHAEHTQLIGPNTPSWIPYPQLGWLAKSVIAGEDAPFYTHDGFNEEGLNRALNELLKDKDNPIGGSSITQQVAKNLFTGNQTTLDRKIEEMVYTLGLEATLSKEAILALYLNSIEFGDGIYGVREASEQYFLKEPKYLSLKEAVFLASILPNPRDGYRRAKRGYPPTRRMKAILQNLVDGNQISSVIMKETMKEPLRLLLPID
jgi:membrane carboxypeptidase/penicillin-binding protein